MAMPGCEKTVSANVEGTASFIIQQHIFKSGFIQALSRKCISLDTYAARSGQPEYGVDDLIIVRLLSSTLSQAVTCSISACFVARLKLKMFWIVRRHLNMPLPEACLFCQDDPLFSFGDSRQEIANNPSAIAAST